MPQHTGQVSAEGLSRSSKLPIGMWPASQIVQFPHSDKAPFIRTYPDLPESSLKFQAILLPWVYDPPRALDKSLPMEVGTVTGSMSTSEVQFLVVDTVIALAGVILFYSSQQLSKRYNSWTTRLRTRMPKINPPPSPEKAQSNYWTMTVFFRVVGGFLFLFSIWAAYDSRH
jgi:hypothetical protein